MTAEHWTIESIIDYPDAKPLVTTSFQVAWKIVLKDGEIEVCDYGTVPLTYLWTDAVVDEIDGSVVEPPRLVQEWIPFPQLTEAKVIEWVKTTLGTDRVAEINRVLQKLIDAAKNPPPAPKKLPWAK